MCSEQRTRLGFLACAWGRDTVFVASERLNQAGAALQRVLDHYRTAPRRTQCRIAPWRRGRLRDRRLVQHRCAHISLVWLRRRSAGRRRDVRRPHGEQTALSKGRREHLSTGMRVASCSSRVNSSWRSSPALLPSWSWFHELWLLYLLVILLEVANCIVTPAFMVELKAEAPEEQRSAANGVLFASMTTAQLVGPVLGALVLAPFGAAAVFALNGLTFLGVAVAVTQMQRRAKCEQRRSRTRRMSHPPDIREAGAERHWIRVAPAATGTQSVHARLPESRLTNPSHHHALCRARIDTRTWTMAA